MVGSNHNLRQSFYFYALFEFSIKQNLRNHWINSLDMLDYRSMIHTDQTCTNKTDAARLLECLLPRTGSASGHQGPPGSNQVLHLWDKIFSLKVNPCICLTSVKLPRSTAVDKCSILTSPRRQWSLASGFIHLYIFCTLYCTDVLYI